jgi:hypothetical protein
MYKIKIFKTDLTEVHLVKIEKEVNEFLENSSGATVVHCSANSDSFIIVVMYWVSR